MVLNQHCLWDELLGTHKNSDSWLLPILPNLSNHTLFRDVACVFVCLEAPQIIAPKDMSTSGLGGSVDPFPGETCPTSPRRLHMVCHYFLFLWDFFPGYALAEQTDFLYLYWWCLILQKNLSGFIHSIDKCFYQLHVLSFYFHLTDTKTGAQRDQEICFWLKFESNRFRNSTQVTWLQILCPFHFPSGHSNEMATRPELCVWSVLCPLSPSSSPILRPPPSHVGCRGN